MSEEQTILDGRAMAESRMIDTCVITRASKPVYNPATLGYDPAEPATVYTGKCQVKSEALVPGSGQAGDQVETLLTYTVSIPVAVTDVRKRDVVTITAVGEVSDPGLVDLSLAVHTVTRRTRLTARRLSCQEVT